MAYPSDCRATCCRTAACTSGTKAAPHGSLPIPGAASRGPAFTVHELSFRTLLYRYFFFGWLFRDVNRGNLLERAAAWRHNQVQAQWLPTYMRRWVGWGLLFYGIGAAVELLFAQPSISALFYVPSAISVPANAVIAAAWVGFKVMRSPQ